MNWRPSVYISAILLLTSLANATLYVENFNYSKPDSNSFSNGIFNHSIIPVPDLTYSAWDISDHSSPPSGNALQLWPAIDEITFNLQPGQYIDYVSCDRINWAKETVMEIYCEDGMIRDKLYATGIWYFSETEEEALEMIGPVTKIRLISSEGAFDNLTVNVVPEPAAILFLSLGGVILTKRKKS
jgi:hypothetical protein